MWNDEALIPSINKTVNSLCLRGTLDPPGELDVIRYMSPFIKIILEATISLHMVEELNIAFCIIMLVLAPGCSVGMV